MNTLLYFLERWHPALFFWAALLAQIFFKFTITQDKITGTANALLTIYAIILGFVSTAISILFSVQDRKFMRTLKTSGAYHEIIKYHWSAMRWCFIVVLISITIVIIGDNSVLTSWQKCLMFKLVMSTAIGAMMATFRVMHLFQKIVMRDSSA